MDIVCCIDMNYVPCCGVMLTSLFENNPGEKFVVHVLGNDLSQEAQGVLRRMTEQKYGQQIMFYPLKQEMLRVFPATCSYVSLTAYAKLFIANILPDSVSKALYVDCDLVVVGCLRPLWDYDLNHQSMAAVKDAHKRLEDDCKRLGIDYRTEGYYNSGVMLINLDYWREMNLLQKGIDFILSYKGDLPYHDQDVLNAVLHGTILPLPYRYNLHDCLFHRIRYIVPEDLAAVAEDLHPDRRVIVHFSSRRKPWGTRCLHPLRNLYFQYLEKTPWCNRRLVYTLRERLWRINRRASGWFHWVNGYRNIK